VVNRVVEDLDVWAVDGVREAAPSQTPMDVLKA
jgi:hypothetical protein